MFMLNNFYTYTHIFYISLLIAWSKTWMPFGGQPCQSVHVENHMLQSNVCNESSGESQSSLMQPVPCMNMCSASVPYGSTDDDMCQEVYF